MNSERYKDPTAEIAIARVMKEDKKKRRAKKERKHFERSGVNGKE